MNNDILTKVKLSENGVPTIPLQNGESISYSDFENLSRPDKRRLHKMLNNATLENDIDYLIDNRNLPNRDAQSRGDVSFGELSQLISNGKVDNSSNRDEELDDDSDYEGKLSHNIRFVDGVSAKSQILASVLTDLSDDKAYIRDNGTFLALAVGDYFDKAVLKGKKWKKLVKNIIKDYKLESSNNKKFMMEIENYFSKLSVQQLQLKYSLKQVVESSEEVSNFYYDTKIQYTLDLYTLYQHQQDMINANLQPNPWIAYNYYMTTLKLTSKYKEHFLGDKLIEFFKDKVGTGDGFKDGKILRSWKDAASKKKVNKLIPVFTAYCISRFCDDIDELKEAYNMIVKYSGHTNTDVKEYWIGMYTRLVNEATYTDIIDFYNKEYKPLFENDDWDLITEKLKEIRISANLYQDTTALQGLHIKKYDTGIWFMSIPLWMKHHKDNDTSLKKLVNRTVKSYLELLSDDIVVQYTNSTKKYSVGEYFGYNASIFKSATAKTRYDYLFQFVPDKVLDWIKGKKDDRDLESKLRDLSLEKHSHCLKANGLPPIVKCYPLSSDNLSTINFHTGDGLQWLHKTPQSEGGKAEDGFLGFEDDNLIGNVKYKNWNFKTQMDYWKLVLEHNANIIETTEEAVVKAHLNNSIATLSILNELDVTVSV